MWNWLYLIILFVILWLAFTRSRPPPKRTKPASNYNGPLYERLVDPLIIGLHHYVVNIIPAGSTVIDACCGTGQLALKLSTECKKVVGIDLSPRMIQVAQKKKTKLNVSNMEFELGDVTEKLKQYPTKSFDYVTICMALHEMPKMFRLPMLKEMSRVGKTVIAVDYAASMPFNSAGLRNRFLEFIAGSEHFANFREFTAEGGVSGLVQASNGALKIENLKLIDKKSITVVYLTSS